MNILTSIEFDGPSDHNDRREGGHLELSRKLQNASPWGQQVRNSEVYRSVLSTGESKHNLPCIIASR